MYPPMFQSTHILSPESGMQEALLRQAEDDLGHERFCRSVLLSMLQHEQAQNVDRMISGLAAKVHHVLAGLLGVDSEMILAELEECIKMASDTWDAARRAKNLYHLSFDILNKDDANSVSIQLPVGTNNKVPQEEGDHELDDDDDILVPVFPHVYMAQSPAMSQLSTGIALHRRQVLQAKKELREQGFRASNWGTTRPKPPSARQRKASVSHAESERATSQSHVDRSLTHGGVGK